MTEGIEYPVVHDKCPVCGSERRVAEMHFEDLKKLGKMPTEAKVGLQAFPLPIPQSGLITAEIPIVFMDACFDCGCVYFVSLEKVKGKLQMRQMPPPGTPPGMGPPMGPRL